MGVEHDSLTVLNISVVLESSGVKSNLFTHFSNTFFVVVGEKIQLEDALCNIGCAHEINFKQLCLEMTFIRSVAFQGFEKESRSFLNSRKLEEDLENTINRSFWNTISISCCDHHCEITSGFWILLNHSPQYFKEIWLVSCLLTVWHNLVELVCLDEALDDFIWGSSLLENAKSHLRVILSDQVSKLVT